MTIENEDTAKPITHQDLTKSLQELSLTLKTLKVLACDLKHKSKLASSKLNQNSKKTHTITTDNNADQSTALH